MKNRLTLNLLLISSVSLLLAACASDTAFEASQSANLSSGLTGEDPKNGELVAVDNDNDGKADGTARIFVPTDRTGLPGPVKNEDSASSSDNNSNSEVADEAKGEVEDKDESSPAIAELSPCKVEGDDSEESQNKFAFCHHAGGADAIHKIQQCLPAVAIYNKVAQNLGTPGLCD